MTTGPTDARAIYVRIADDLRAQIETRRLVPGAQLPTIPELATSYVCSQQSARQALDLLRQQGLIITRHGKGSFVREHPVVRRHGRDRYSRSRWQTHGTLILIAEAAEQGYTATQLIREIVDAPAPEAVADRLNIPAGEMVLVRRRTTLINGRPNQLADSYYPADIAGKVPQLRQEETGPGGGFARLEDAGYKLATIREEVTVRMPTGPESVALALPEGTPVAVLTRTTKDQSGRPVEVMLAIIAGDMIAFDDEFPIPE
jgi:GntR family transcriptional regulator